MYFIKDLLLVIFNVLTFFTICDSQTTNPINPCQKHFDIVSDLGQEDCPAGFVFQENGNGVFNCFSHCVKPDLTCSDTKPCLPGYYCSDQDSKCVEDPNSCLYQLNHPTNPWEGAWKPTCLPDGSWAAKQCKGEPTSGRCFCYDTVGNRIFGQAFSDKAENMTCACSRRKTEIRSLGLQIYTTLHCDTMGNYEPLQCDEGHCWCVETKTGEIISKIVPSSVMTRLPCYSKDEIGLNYSRQCESDEFAQKNLLHEFNLHGTDHINYPHVNCDDDGNYGAYQIDGAQIYCKWWDNSNLGYGADVAQIRDINCYCARDTKMYQESGSTQLLICLSNGNYQPIQYHTINNQWYCVDKDGFKCTDFSDEYPKYDVCYPEDTTY